VDKRENENTESQSDLDDDTISSQAIQKAKDEETDQVNDVLMTGRGECGEPIGDLIARYASPPDPFEDQPIVEPVGFIPVKDSKKNSKNKKPRRDGKTSRFFAKPRPRREAVRRVKP